MHSLQLKSADAHLLIQRCAQDSLSRVLLPVALLQHDCLDCMIPNWILSCTGAVAGHTSLSDSSPDSARKVLDVLESGSLLRSSTAGWSSSASGSPLELRAAALGGRPRLRFAGFAGFSTFSASACSIMVQRCPGLTWNVVLAGMHATCSSYGFFSSALAPFHAFASSCVIVPKLASPCAAFTLARLALQKSCAGNIVCDTLLAFARH